MIKDAYSSLHRHLDSGENLLWYGQPKGGIIFRKGDFFFIPFGAIWTAFSIFWTYMAAGSSLLFAMFGIPFILVGLMMLFGRYIYDKRARENTYYGVTKKRCLFVTGSKEQKVKSLEISDITELQYSEKQDGSGSLFLGPQNPQALTFGSSYPGLESNYMFEGIPDVRKVYSVITLLQKNQREME